jgi:hypothetical protein
MPAMLQVTATVPNETRQAFDHWYQTEHLPDAQKAFGVTTAFRGWDTVDHTKHHAFYLFDSIEQASQVLGGETLQVLIAEFDRVWQSQISRQRSIINITQDLTGTPIQS